MDKKSTIAFYALGIAQRRLGESVEALKSFNTAINVNTGINTIYQEIYFEMGEDLNGAEEI